MRFNFPAAFTESTSHRSTSNAWSYLAASPADADVYTPDVYTPTTVPTTLRAAQSGSAETTRPLGRRAANEARGWVEANTSAWSVVVASFRSSVGLQSHLCVSPDQTSTYETCSQGGFSTTRPLPHTRNRAPVVAFVYSMTRPCSGSSRKAGPPFAVRSRTKSSDAVARGDPVEETVAFAMPSDVRTTCHAPPTRTASKESPSGPPTARKVVTLTSSSTVVVMLYSTGMMSLVVSNACNQYAADADNPLVGALELTRDWDCRCLS